MHFCTNSHSSHFSATISKTILVSATRFRRPFRRPVLGTTLHAKISAAILQPKAAKCPFPKYTISSKASLNYLRTYQYSGFLGLQAVVEGKAAAGTEEGARNLGRTLDAFLSALSAPALGALGLTVVGLLGGDRNVLLWRRRGVVGALRGGDRGGDRYGDRGGNRQRDYDDDRVTGDNDSSSSRSNCTSY